MEPPGSRIPLPAHFPKDNQEESDDVNYVDEIASETKEEKVDASGTRKDANDECAGEENDTKGIDVQTTSAFGRKKAMPANEQAATTPAPPNSRKSGAVKDRKRRSDHGGRVGAVHVSHDKLNGSDIEQGGNHNQGQQATTRKSWSEKEARRSSISAGAVVGEEHKYQESNNQNQQQSSRKCWAEKEARRISMSSNNRCVSSPPTPAAGGNPSSRRKSVKRMPGRKSNLSTEGSSARSNGSQNHAVTEITPSLQLEIAQLDAESDAATDEDLGINSECAFPMPLLENAENHEEEAYLDDRTHNNTPLSQAQENADNPEEHLESLVIANAVEDMSYRNLPTAQQVDNTQIKSSRATWKNLGILSAMAVTMIVGIALLVVFLVGGFNDNEPNSVIEIGNSNNNTTNGTTSPTLSPTFSPENYVLSFLPRDTVKTIQSNPASSQARAFQWLLNNTLLYNYSEHRLLQRYGLAAFYYSTSGDDWHNNTNWLSDLNECEWYNEIYSQFNCSELFLDISQDNFPYWYLHMRQNNLRGSIPDELYLLTQLESINLESNFLSGGISSNIGHLTELLYLNLPNNGLVSSLPSEIGLLQNLQFLFAYANEITGSIPTELANAASLTYLTLLNNQLTGTIPWQLGQLPSLMFLGLSENQLTSTIPPEFVNLTGLTVLVLDSNLLTGTVPPLVMPNLTTFFLHFNSFSGSIPSELGVAHQMKQIEMSSNQLTGNIPSELGLMTALTELWMFENSLQGPIPSELGLLENMQILRLGKNQLTSSLPTELLQIRAVQWVSLEENLLTGTLPSELGLLQNITRLDLWENQLTSSLPSEIGTLLQMVFFDIDINQISGQVPTEIGNCKSLVQLILNMNPISGTIPTELGQLTKVTALLMHTTSVSGSIPTEFGGLQSVELLSLRNNNLNGSLPSELGNLSNMTLFKAQNNSITGNITSSFGRLQNLDLLDLSTNGLLGTIPKSLGSLVKNGSLSTLNVSGNPELKGRVPSLLCSLNSELAFDCSDSLCGCSCECTNGSVEVTFASTTVLPLVSKPEG